ncbi:MAG: WD40/YVTN/BNR-like repeat-containing protein [Candidatus Aminicenantales bacterium]
MLKKRIRPLFALILTMGALLCLSSALPAQSGAAAKNARQKSVASAPSMPDFGSAFRYRFVGPPGNRVSAVVCDSNDPNVYYAGACAGGVWKSTDGATSWFPIFDDQTSQSIGALAIAPSDSNQVWVGTGEAFIRSNVLVGDGIYKSTNAGDSFTRMGLEKSGRIGRIIVDPRNPDVVFAAALGHCYGPQKERGVYRTKDGGKTWEQVLFIDENTGCSGLAMDPNNPRTLFAGMWTMTIRTWGQESGGPGGGVYVSRDGGDTWTKLRGRGLPEFEVGKVDVAVARSNSNTVYALMETGDRGSLWRSTDGGNRWEIASYERRIVERPHYYTRMCIAPDDEKTVYFPCNSMYVTYDGGDSIENFSGGGDSHDMWADPKNPKRLMIGHDGGMSITTTRGESWRSVVLPIGQMYHVATDTRIPYWVLSNMQDATSKCGPSNSFAGPDLPVWYAMGGCESGFTYADPVDPDIVWSTCYSGTIEVYNRKTGLIRNVNPWPEKSLDSPPGILKYRWNWSPPLAISPHDHNKVYFGSQYVHMTTDGGQHWTVISPDLTTNDKGKMGTSGGLFKDNLGVEYGCTMFAIAESPAEKDVIWAGSNDGLIHVTRDGGKTWKNVTPAGMPVWGTVSMIDPSKFDKGRCYVAVDGHQESILDPYLFKTTDYGATWKMIQSDIPKSVLSYTSAIKEDPVRKGLLYAGTANAIYISFNDGENWIPFQANLPRACVTWITVQEHFNDLVLGTNGRGVYIMDDVTPLQQATPEALAADVFFFNPRPAYRFKNTAPPIRVPNENSRSQDPAYGATINYLLKSPAAGPVRLAIKDENGALIRTINGTRSKGFNRVVWNLREEPVRQIDLRTTPSFHPHVWEEKRFKGKEVRPVLHWGIQPPQQGVLAPPGKYTVTLSVDGKETSRELVVLKDPNSSGSVESIKEMVGLWRNAVVDLNATVDMINQLEWVGKQVEDLIKLLGATKNGDQVLSDVLEFQKAYMTLEDKMLQRQLHASDPKSYKAEMMLFSKLLWFSGEVGTGAGDIRNTEDMGPTSQQLEVYDLLNKRFQATRAEFDDFIKAQVPAFNKKLAEKNFTAIVTGQKPSQTPLQAGRRRGNEFDDD